MYSPGFVFSCGRQCGGREGSALQTTCAVLRRKGSSRLRGNLRDEEARSASLTIGLFGEHEMRLDKYLKISRLIKRRTVANEACDNGRVTLNGRVARASAEVKPGDIIGIAFGNRETKVEVLAVQENVRKEAASDMFRYLPAEEKAENTAQAQEED